MTDYYGVLGVHQQATDVEIKRAYRKLARELHPDVNPDEEARVRFSEITTAYEVLSDPEKRRIVDMGGDPMASAGSGFSGGFNGFGGGGLGDVFEAFFGGAGQAASRGPRGRVHAGADALVRVTLDLEECAVGVTKEITVDTAVLCDLCQGEGTAEGSSPVTCNTCKGAGEIQSVQRSFLGQVMTTRLCPTCDGAGVTIPNPCPQCGGDGRVRSRRTIEVKIPAGVGDGMRIRLAGKGEVGPGGGQPGDLYVEVSEKRHEYLNRDGDDLHVTVAVPMVDAVLGTTIEVATVLGSTAKVTIEPGTQPASVISIAGHGMPRLHTGVRGDLKVHLDVVVPSKLDSKQTQALREFKAHSRDQSEIVSRSSKHDGGVFSRLRNTFAGR